MYKLMMTHTNNIVIDEKRKLGIVLNYPSLENSQVGMTLELKI